MSIDWFIADVPAVPARSVDRRRVLVQGAFVSAFVCSGFLVQRLLIDPDLGARHANIAAATALLWSIPFILRGTRRYRFAAHALVAILSLAIINDCALFGSLAQPPVIAFLITPLMAAFYLGPRATTGYGGLMAVAATGLVVLERQGLLPQKVVVPPEMWLGAATGLILFLVFVMRIYEAERDAQNQKTLAILENMVEGVAGVSAAGVLEFTNDAFDVIVGVSAVPTPIADLPDPWAGSLADALGGGEGPPVTALANGRLYSVAASNYPAGAVVVLRDVTHETEIDRMKTEFTSVVSHELRTPLAAVLGFSKIIRKRLDQRILPHVSSDDPKTAKAVKQVTENLGTIVSEGERLSHLIDDILDIAKMESGQMSWDLRPIAPEDVVGRAVEATRVLVSSGVELRTEIEDDLPQVRGDSERLHQLMINFIANAAKFTKAGAITVAAKRRDGLLELSVTDTGPGIADDDLSRIFEKFRQTEQRLAGAKGTGLGLAICREIATAHGGSVHASSTVGAGSRFSARLPLLLD